MREVEQKAFVEFNLNHLADVLDEWLLLSNGIASHGFSVVSPAVSPAASPRLSPGSPQFSPLKSPKLSGAFSDFSLDSVASSLDDQKKQEWPKNGNKMIEN